MRFISALTVCLAIFLVPATLSAQLFEDFESGSKTGYAAANLTLSTGTWLFDDALIGLSDGDRTRDARAARIRNGFIQMEFDKPNGVGEVSFWAANFSNDVNSELTVFKSINGAPTWTQVGDPIPMTSTLTEYTITINEPGDVRFRFANTNGANTRRLNIDDVRITDYVEVSEEPSLLFRIDGTQFISGEQYDFGQVSGQVSATLQLRNEGVDSLKLSSFGISGEGFTLTGDTLNPIGSLETRNLTLSFEAQNPGEYQGALSFVSNDPDNASFELLLRADVLDLSSPISISEARALPQGTTVTVSGWVTVTDEFAGPVYFQDETGGLAWYSNSLMREAWGLDLQHGDSLVITGELGEFNELLQIVNQVNYQIFPEANRTIEPAEITFSQLNSGAFESRLVRVNNVNFSSTGQFSGGNNYTANDGTASSQVRIDNFTNITGAPIPSGPANVTGVAGRFLQTRQLLPRSRADIREVSDGPIILSAPPFEAFATATSITFEWETETAGHSEVRFGRTSSLEKGSVSIEDRNTHHRVTITELSPATTYKVQLRSAADSDTSFTATYITSTASPEGASGEILVFFNRTVDHSLALEREADENVNFRDKLIDRLNAAQQSADLAFYSISGDVGNAIVDAIIAAHNSGVQVRVITSGHTSNINDVVQRLLDSDVPATRSLGSNQHHNKFAIFDVISSDPTDPWVVTSSWNATNDGTFNQQQNMVHFQDVALARAYRLEFDQMWGGDYGPFNSGNARFSRNKEVVNPSQFWIGPDSVRVELYFSPQADTEAQINRTILTAQENIDLNLNLITRRPISNTILSRSNQGVKVRGVIGQINLQNDEFPYLSSWADVIQFSQSFGLLHHKVGIIDGQRPTPNSKVITGSHNWSANANNNNDENTVIIHSERVANEYFQEFGARYVQAGGTETLTTVSVYEEPLHGPSVVSLRQNYPNPFNPVTTINFDLPEATHVRLEVFDMLGRRVSSLAEGSFASGTHAISFDGANVASGVYLYRLEAGNQVITRKMMLVK